MTGRCALVDRIPLNATHLASNPKLPAFIYGTAWKKEATTDLVYQALRNGFTAIDTAAQPKHYREDLVGKGLRQAFRDKLVKRSDVFIQTKFTSVDGHDPKNMPYKAGWSITEQVKHSIQSSLKNFDFSQEDDSHDDQAPYIDSLVLHSPLRNLKDTMLAWRTLESFVPEYIHTLGISNTNLATLQYLYDNATVKPTVVQNRFCQATRFDTELRTFCKDKGIVYQSFWTLGANPRLLKSAPVQKIATGANISPEAALYCCVLGLGNTVILNGTTNAEHMQADWRAIDQVRLFIDSDPAMWQRELGNFKQLLSLP